MDASGLITLPNYPTTTGELTNDSGFITNAALTDYATTSDVSTAISSQTKETWTFTLEDGTTVTKTVVLGAQTMAIDFSQVKTITIPEGSVTKITDSTGNILWQGVQSEGWHTI